MAAKPPPDVPPNQLAFFDKLAEIIATHVLEELEAGRLPETEDGSR